MWNTNMEKCTQWYVRFKLGQWWTGKLWSFLLAHMMWVSECLGSLSHKVAEYTDGRPSQSWGYSPGSGHFRWVSDGAVGPIWRALPPQPSFFLLLPILGAAHFIFLSLWALAKPQLHLSSASSSLKLFLFSCKWAVYDDHYLNGLRRAPGCLSAADGRLIRCVSSPSGPGPKSGAVLIMAPLGLGAGGWGLGTRVRDSTEFCLIIKGKALLSVYAHSGSDSLF